MRFSISHAAIRKHLLATAIAASCLLVGPLAGATTASGGPPEPDAGFGGSGGTGGGSSETGGSGGAGGSQPSESSGCALAADHADGAAWGVALAAALALAAQRRRATRGPSSRG
jgi:hypothetical protein